jgi:hypothetical protein
VRKAFAILLFLISSVALHSQVGAVTRDTSLTDANDTKFKVGQIWHYKTRKGEEQSTLIVLKIDKSPAVGIIVHVGIRGIQYHSCIPAEAPDHIEHMPFSRKALDESVTELAASSQPIPDFFDAYNEWRALFTDHKVGIYTTTVADALDFGEKSFRKGIGCKD